MARKGTKLLFRIAWAGVFIPVPLSPAEGEADSSGGNNPFCFQENTLIGFWVTKG